MRTSDLDARGIRTPSLRIWNPTRCHCAMASSSLLGGSTCMSRKHARPKQKAVDARGTRTPSLRIWNPTRYHCAMASIWGQAKRRAEQIIGSQQKREQKIKRTPPLGIEPRTCRLTADRSANGALKAAHTTQASLRVARGAQAVREGPGIRWGATVGHWSSGMILL